MTGQDNWSSSTDLTQLDVLSKEHVECLSFAEEIANIAKHGDEADLLRGIELIKAYNENEMEAHLQHEEQTIFAPLIQQYKKHIELCIELGKEHGYFRTVVETISTKTARKDLADFAATLVSHTHKEEEQLFPQLKELFTDEQLDAVKQFEPFRRMDVQPGKPAQVDNSLATDDQKWLDLVAKYFVDKGQVESTVFLLPRYQPDTIESIADHLKLEFFDFQAEVMEQFGVDADSISIDQLNDTLLEKASRNGIVSHNVEALLCVKTDEERQKWLTSFLAADWANPVLLPLAIFHDDVSDAHPRVCNLRNL